MMTGRWAAIIAITTVVSGGSAYASNSQSEPQIAPRIFGGDDAGENDWPWAVLIAAVDPASTPGSGSVRAFRCAGTLINEHYVLTAAHCMFNDATPPQKVDTVYISYNQVDAPAFLDDYTTRAAEIFSHADYNEFSSSDFNNDIALLKLAEPADLSAYPQLSVSSDIQQLELMTQEERDDIVTALGWGATEETDENGANILPSTLQIVALDYIKRSDCNAQWAVHISDTMVCAAELDGPTESAPAGQDTCFGDSGGPLFLGQQNDPVIIGITSFGSPNCGEPAPPGVYTNIAFYREWIDLVMAGTLPGPTPPPPSLGSSSSSGSSIGLWFVAVLLVIRRMSNATFQRRYMSAR